MQRLQDALAEVQRELEAALEADSQSAAPVEESPVIPAAAAVADPAPPDTPVLPVVHGPGLSAVVPA